jgi:hypothetical protein
MLGPDARSTLQNRLAWSPVINDMASQLPIAVVLVVVDHTIF